jgi:hypothetical protein
VHRPAPRIPIPPLKIIQGLPKNNSGDRSLYATVAKRGGIDLRDEKMSLANLFEHGGADGEAQGDDRRFVPIGSTGSSAVGSIYWDLTGHPRGGEFRRLTQDATLHYRRRARGELYRKLRSPYPHHDPSGEAVAAGRHPS